MQLGLELHKDELDQLPVGANMVLAAACTQRHSVNYHTFAGGSASRRSKQFDAILDSIWRDIGYERLSTDQLEKLRLRAEQLVPEEGRPGPRQYDGYGQFAAEALIICCDAAGLRGDSTKTVYIAMRSFESIRAFLRKTCRAWQLPDGRLRSDVEALCAAHPLTLNEHRRQERDLNDVKYMMRERCSLIDVVETLKSRSQAEVLFPISSGEAT